MRNIFYLFVILFSNLTGQNPVILINNSSPKWSYTLYDANYTNTSGTSQNGYKANFIRELFDYKGNVFIHVVSNNDRNDLFGNAFILLDSKSGQPLWETWYNKGNSMDQQSIYNHCEIKDDFLYCTGRIKLGQPNEPFPGWDISKQSVYSLLKLDLKNGQIIEEVFDQTDTIGVMTDSRSGLQFLSSNDQMGVMRMPDPYILKNYHFALYDKNSEYMRNDSLYFADQNVNVVDSFKVYFSFSHFKINKQKVGGIIFNGDSSPFPTKKQCIVSVFDTEDTNGDINITRSTSFDIGDKIISPPSTIGFFPQIYSTHDQINFSMLYLDPNNFSRCWLARYDTDGHEIMYNPSIVVGTYKYSNIRPVWNELGQNLYMAFGSRDPDALYDIIRIDDDAKVSIVSSVKLSSPGLTKNDFSSLQAWMDSTNVYLSVKVKNNETMVLAKSISELNIDIVSKTHEISNGERPYPNPTSQKVFLPSIVNNTMAFVYNMDGIMVKSIPVTDNEIDLSDVPSSSYIVQCRDISSKQIKSFRIVKI